MTPENIRQIADRNHVRRSNVDPRNHIENRVLLEMMADIDALLLAIEQLQIEKENQNGLRKIE